VCEQKCVKCANVFLQTPTWETITF